MGTNIVVFICSMNWQPYHKYHHIDNHVNNEKRGQHHSGAGNPVGRIIKECSNRYSQGKAEAEMDYGADQQIAKIHAHNLRNYRKQRGRRQPCENLLKRSIHAAHDCQGHRTHNGPDSNSCKQIR